MGTESFTLQIDKVAVLTQAVTKEYATYFYQHTAKVTEPKRIRIVFSGDEYNEAKMINTNINVDWIEVNGSRIQTESASVFSTGTWLEADQVKPGYGRGESLDTNGYFQFGR